MLRKLLDLLFPPKCILCRRLLSQQQTDLCHDCRQNAPAFTKGKFKIPFLAGWTALWYYKDTVRASILRYKFYGRRSYAAAYGRLLAMKLQTDGWDDFDILTWVPISAKRRRKRGFDQVELLTKFIAEELQVQAIPTLRKIRHTPPQSTKKDAASRRANVLGAYKVICPDTVRDKRILLLDDIITTGATASECAKMLSIGGAAQIKCAAIAVASHEKTSN